MNKETEIVNQLGCELLEVITSWWGTKGAKEDTEELLFIMAVMAVATLSFYESIRTTELSLLDIIHKQHELNLHLVLEV